MSKNQKFCNFSVKMGRKIPGKKHHGSKDPEKQKEKREAELRLKVSFETLKLCLFIALVLLFRLILLQKILMTKKYLRNC